MIKNWNKDRIKIETSIDQHLLTLDTLAFQCRVASVHYVKGLIHHNRHGHNPDTHTLMKAEPCGLVSHDKMVSANV